MSTESMGTPRFLSGNGEMNALIAAKNWSETELGAMDRWPQALKTVIQVMLGSRYAMWMAWGTRLSFFCNDAYIPTLGVKHPWALGNSATEVWREIWPQIGPRIETVITTNKATWDEGLQLFLERHGYPEETYHTFSYSPIPDDSGAVGGMLCVVTEETVRVIAARRLGVLREFAHLLTTARTATEVFAALKGCLSQHREDLPFTMTYLADSEDETARLSLATGIETGTNGAPERIDLSNQGVWPLGEVISGSAPRNLDDLAERFQELPSGVWQKPPRQAVVLPIILQGHDRPIGAFIAGLNPFRPHDEEYANFMHLLVAQLGSGLANARAYAEEHRRAEALAKIDRAKTAFFSNASHEFRTPLTLLLSPVEDLLARTSLTDEVMVERDELLLIHRNALRLLKLVNTLLDFSRIEAGRLQASYEPVDIAGYTGELASTFRAAIEKAGLVFRIECAPISTPVYVDREMWEKIVLNLISNAFKYTLQGSIAVGLDETDAGKAVRLTVRDTGVGIPAHELPHLFERFHRVEGQKGRTQEGSGIGLALVQELARLHGGTVSAESSIGEGAIFTVSLPTGAAHLPQERIGPSRENIGREDIAAPAASAYVTEALRWLPGDLTTDQLPLHLDIPGPEIAPPTSDRPVILIADDNADMRDYLRRLMARRFEVVAVGDGEQALQAARLKIPDLILSDVMMPRLDGFGLVRALRADAKLQNIPIILLSARAGEEARVEGIESGADDYLVKPFGARELLARVAANLDLARIRNQAMIMLREETRRLETLYRTGAALAGELDLARLVQLVTDACVELTGARFGAYFYNVANEAGESYTLYTLSGAQRSDFAGFPMPRNTEVFGPTFRGEGVVRSDDITRDPRYGRNAPYFGMPHGHLPVRSYLALPVISRSGTVWGGLFLAHPEPNMFTERDELIIAGIASQTAIAMDNAQLFKASREAEQALRSLNETLEDRVVTEIGKRVKAEEAFRQAQKMEAIGQLTGGVAHDFNNLLAVVLGSLETLRRRAAAGQMTISDPAFSRLTDAASQAAQRAATLTQRLLAFSRRQPLDPKPVNPNRLVTGITELLRSTMKEDVRIETVLAGGIWWASLDANQLESALLNLAVNARDAMPAGGSLTIETANSFLDEAYAAGHEEVAPGQYVMIAVSDTGSGMPPDVLARAFDPFFTTKGIGEGTGLGLSQVYGFVKQSGGHVKIYSEPGEGTTVRIYLPRLSGGDFPSGQPDVAEAVGRAGGELVLVVEDDPHVRAYSTDMISELGYRVIEAENGHMALAALEKHPDVRLVFTDVGLPGGMNGRQLADEAQRRFPGLLVLFTTGYARNAIVHHGRLDPGLDLIVKPYTFAALAKKIQSVLSGD
jgi:signal transduction histidine kinase/DNA-binding response OmpR family regulator